MKNIISASNVILVSVMLGGCGFSESDECAPHSEVTITASDEQHVAQRWVSICGFPGSTVTDLVSVTDEPIKRPSWFGNFAFNEDQGGTSRDQISASWIDDHHLRITVDAVGDVRDSPHRAGDVAITYVLGPSIDLDSLKAQKQSKIDERRKWERLKTSASWHYVEDSYNTDAYLIDHYQRFINWVQQSTEPRP